MRSSSSYRGAKKRAAREAEVPFAQFNERYARSRHFAAAQVERAALNSTPEAAQRALDVLGDAPLSNAEARKRLAVWASNGGRATVTSPAIDQAELDEMNKAKPLTPEETESAVEATKKLTVEDIDKALEKALSRWQEAGNVTPMPLSKIFAARARQLGWAEDVEFEEE